MADGLAVSRRGIFSLGTGRETFICLMSELFFIKSDMENERNLLHSNLEE